MTTASGRKMKVKITQKGTCMGQNAVTMLGDSRWLQYVMRHQASADARSTPYASAIKAWPSTPGTASPRCKTWQGDRQSCRGGGGNP